MIANISVALDFVEAHGVRLVGIDAKNIYDGDSAHTLGLMYTLIVRFEVQRYGGDVGDLLRWLQQVVLPTSSAPAAPSASASSSSSSTSAAAAAAAAVAVHSLFRAGAGVELRWAAVLACQRTGQGQAQPNNTGLAPELQLWAAGWPGAARTPQPVRSSPDDSRTLLARAIAAIPPNSVLSDRCCHRRCTPMQPLPRDGGQG